VSRETTNRSFDELAIGLSSGASREARRSSWWGRPSLGEGLHQ